MRFYSKTCVKWPLSKRPKNSFQDQVSLNAGQKYYRMLQILSTFIKLPVVFKTFVLSIFEWPFQTGFTVFIFHFPTAKAQMSLSKCAVLQTFTHSNGSWWRFKPKCSYLAQLDRLNI